MTATKRKKGGRSFNNAQQTTFIDRLPIQTTTIIATTNVQAQDFPHSSLCKDQRIDSKHQNGSITVLLVLPTFGQNIDVQSPRHEILPPHQQSTSAPTLLNNFNCHINSPGVTSSMPVAISATAASASLSMFGVTPICWTLSEFNFYSYVHLWYEHAMAMHGLNNRRYRTLNSFLITIL